MPFIGVVAKENESNFIKNEITKNAKENKFEIININKKSIENVKNIKFNILVVCENIEGFLKNSNYLKNIINKANYIIINSDKNKNLEFLNYNKNLVTYGLSSKSTVTISSIKDEDSMFCVQNKIKGIDKNTVEEQEFIVNIKKNNINKIYNLMVIFIIFLIYGEKIKKIRKN